MASYRVQKINEKDIADKVAKLLASYINLNLESQQRVKFALSGGSSPAKVYTSLGNIPLPWDRVDVILGDERWVDPEDDSSNSKMIRKTLLSSPYGKNACFYPYETLLMDTPSKSAQSFSKILQKLCNGSPPILDLVLLGLGDDGHTASLFPQSSATKEIEKYVTIAKGNGLERLTLTAPVISASKKVVFLVTGSHKKEALRRLLDSRESVERTPAKLIQPSTEILIAADYSAAELV
tara:strand:+ start:66 stop:776 length:711 start_codon:yes stop_codon:yes gene_type:complete